MCEEESLDQEESSEPPSDSEVPNQDQSAKSLNHGKNSDSALKGKRMLDDLSIPAGKRQRRSLPQSSHNNSSTCTSRRRDSDRPSLRRGSKGQKQSDKVQGLLQEHGNTTVCVC